MRIKKAVVTGAAGFIGSHLSKYLYDCGVEILALDNYSNVPEGRLDYLFPNKEVVIHNVDILNRGVMSNLMASFGSYDVFFDLAYINGTKQFYTRPVEILAHAGKHVEESLYWIKKSSARWVYFSTPEIYGEPGIIPTPEDHRILISDIKNPRFSYAIGKIFSESFIHGALISDQNLDVVIVRPNNAYGPTDRYHVISEMLEKIFKGEELTIQGAGHETRAFCYIDDMVNQIILIAEKGLKAETYTMGSSEEVSISSLVDMITEATGYDGGRRNIPLLAGSPLRRCPDLSKLKQIGAFKNRSLKDGLLETIKHELQFRKLR